jgi:CheY-like chemotaxis protein
MNGAELTRELRRIDDGQTIVLMLTGYNFDDMSDDATAAGADGVIDKPLFTDTLQREILRALKSKGGSFQTEAPQEGQGGEDGPQATLEGRHVLLAEDIDINAEIIIDLLDLEEVTAEHAENGQVAVDMFAASEPGHFDAILMDVRMPVMDGLTAASTIRKLDHPDAKTVPIIALTANAFDEDMQHSLQAGMNAHLSKPVEPDRLYETLGKLIASRE